MPVQRGRDLAARARVEHGVPVVYTEYPMAHQVAMESVQQAQAWLDAVARGRAAVASRCPRPRPRRW